MSARGARKRARAQAGSILAASNDGATPAPGNAGAASRKRGEEFWHEGGRIILVARGVEFRIYGGVLAEQVPPSLQGHVFSAAPTSGRRIFDSHASRRRAPLPYYAPIRLRISVACCVLTCPKTARGIFGMPCVELA